MTTDVHTDLQPDGTTAPDRRQQLVVAVLWVGVLLVTAVFAYHRYTTTVSGPGGFDFHTFVRAGRAIADGHSPYANPTHSPYPYVYPPLIALLLAPFSHVAFATLWHTWTGLQLTALGVTAGAFVVARADRLVPWTRPLVFGLCVLSAMHFWPTTYGLYIGQSDVFVLAAVMLSALAAARALPATRGVFLGIAGLLKAWPAAVALVLVQRGLRDRVRSLVALVLTLLLAPVMALAVGGTSGLSAFVKSVFNARQQNLVSNSVWGVPFLLFSHSGLAKPLTVSKPLEVVAVLVLAAFVVGLLVVTLRIAGDPVLCTWNVMVCIVLLLPISHLAYSVLVLPLLWIWGVKLVDPETRSLPNAVVFGVLVVWWVVQSKAWPGDGSSAAISSVRFSVVFVVNLMAVTASVAGAWLSARNAGDGGPAPVGPANGSDVAVPTSDVPQAGPTV